MDRNHTNPPIHTDDWNWLSVQTLNLEYAGSSPAPCTKCEANMKYYQCELSQDTGRMTSWIESRGAKSGATIEIFGAGNWVVDKVHPFALEASELHDKQKRDRNCLPSINQS